MSPRIEVEGPDGARKQTDRQLNPVGQEDGRETDRKGIGRPARRDDPFEESLLFLWKRHGLIRAAALSTHNDINLSFSVIPGLTKLAPDLIRGNPVFSWIPAFAGMTAPAMINYAVYNYALWAMEVGSVNENILSEVAEETDQS